MSAELRSAVAAGVLAAARGRAPLLQSIVDVACATFGAQAASIMRYDADRDELVFETVSGAGSGALVGSRLPAGAGIAGWVLAAHEPLVVEDVDRDPRFAVDVAQRSGYVPKGIMASPLLHEERAVGVISVLDRPQRSRFSLIELELLGLFAGQAAIALDLLQCGRLAELALDGSAGELTALASVAAALERLQGARRASAGRLLAALDELVSDDPGTDG